MATVTKFGLGQIANPTPMWATWIFRILLYAGAVVNIILSIVTEIPPDVKLVVAKYTVEGLALVHAITKLFGVSIPDDPTQNQN